MVAEGESAGMDVGTIGGEVGVGGNNVGVGVGNNSTDGVGGATNIGLQTQAI